MGIASTCANIIALDSTVSYIGWKIIFTYLTYKIMGRKKYSYIVSPILQMRRLRLREYYWFAQVVELIGEELDWMEFHWSYSLEYLSNTLQGLNFQNTCSLTLAQNNHYVHTATT